MKLITKEVEFEADTAFVCTTAGKEGPQINTIIQYRFLCGSGQGQLNHVNTNLKFRILYGSEPNIIFMEEFESS